MSIEAAKANLQTAIFRNLAHCNRDDFWGFAQQRIEEAKRSRSATIAALNREIEKLEYSNVLKSEKQLTQDKQERVRIERECS